MPALEAHRPDQLELLAGGGVRRTKVSLKRH